MDVPNFFKDVPTFINDAPNFVKDVPRVTKCVLRLGLTHNFFLIGSKMKSCTIHVQIGDPKTIESDVPNLMKDVPNFCEGCTKGSKVRSEMGIDS